MCDGLVAEDRTLDLPQGLGADGVEFGGDIGKGAHAPDPSLPVPAPKASKSLTRSALKRAPPHANGEAMKPIHIIGAGMAGSEAAWQAACAGIPVVLHEMRPKVGTDAHKTGGFAELVCSNSFRSDDAEQNAVGLLHWEMRRAGSLIMAMADRHQVPAGGALAVDRDAFSEEVTDTLKRHPLVSG